MKKHRRRWTITVIRVASALAGLLVMAGMAFGSGGLDLARRSPPSEVAKMALTGVEVASVHGGALSVTDAATGTSVVVASGPYVKNLGSAIQDPGFSHDGRFVAYLETAGSRPALHVVPLAGGNAATVPDATSYAWSPTQDDLAVTLPSQVELVSARGGTLRRWRISDPFAELFAPSGRSIVVGSSGLRSGRGYLRLLPVGAGAERFIRQPGCDEPAGWTADGSHLLFWRDQECSASIGADGLPLDSIPTSALANSAGGRPSRIVSVAGTLPYSRWVVPVSGDTVLVDSGGDRVAADHKTLRRCSAATGICKSLSLPAGITTLDPGVASRNDQLFEIRVSQSNAMNDFLPHGTLWMSTMTGQHARELTSAGTGVADPIPTADGSELLFVRMVSSDFARVEELTVRTGAVRPLATVDLADFYGEFMAPEVLAVWPTHDT